MLNELAGLKFTIIEYNSTEYKQELELRNRILRLPLGMNIFEEELSGEMNDIHLGAFINDQLVACLLIREIDRKLVKIRQVAVDDKYQGKYIGKQLVLEAEQLIKNRGYKKVVLHARQTAVGFYERMKYQSSGKEFEEINILHQEMYKFF